MVTDDKLRLAAQALGIKDPAELDRAMIILGMVAEDAPSGNGTAPAVSELDAALAEDEGVEVLADLAGVPIRIRPVTPGQMLRFTASLGGSASDAGVGFGQLVRIVIHDEDQEKAWAAIDAAGWTIEQSLGWVQEQVEVSAGRPTVPSSPSREQRRRTTGRSSGVSKRGGLRSA